MNCKKRLSTLTIFACLIVGLLSLKATGQDTASKKDAPATKQAGIAQAGAQDDEVEQFESFDDFKKSRVTSMRAYSARYRAAKTAEEKRAVFETKPDTTPYLDQLEGFIREGSAEEAEKVAKWWMHGARGERDADRIIDALIEVHIDAEFLTGFVPRLNYSLSAEKAEAIHRTVLEKNSHDSVKASATYYLQVLLSKKAETLEGEKAKAVLAEIDSLQNSIKNEYPEMVDVFGTPFVKLVEGNIFARSLEVGKTAPDMIGSDLDGVDFKLSDYKGKVTVVDFWGVW